MDRKFKSLVDGAAAVGLVVAGAVAASADGATVVEKVGYFEVQGEDNPTPAGWFSEGDDGIADVSFSLDSVVFAGGSGPVGLNKIVDVPVSDGLELGMEADGSADYSLVLTSDDVEYLRISSTDDSLENWVGTGYFTADGRVSYVATQSLADWFAEDFLGEGALVHQIGARHHSGEGLGSVDALSFEGVTYDFGLVKDVTPFDQADIDAALGVVPAGYVAQSELDAAKSALEAAEAEVATLEAKVAEQTAAAAAASDALLKAQAEAPSSIKGKLKVGTKLSVKGASFKGITVTYQWKVGGKNAGKKATLTLKKKHAKKAVSVVVTKTYTDSTGKKVSVKTTVKATKAAKVTR